MWRYLLSFESEFMYMATSAVAFHSLNVQTKAEVIVDEAKQSLRSIHDEAIYHFRPTELQTSLCWAAFWYVLL